MSSDSPFITFRDIEKRFGVHILSSVLTLWRTRLQSGQDQVDALYERWKELEEREGKK